MKLANLSYALRWLRDISEQEGEMIECKNYTKSYLGFDLISQNELEEITRILNIIIQDTYLFRKLIIINSMGEIIPYWTGEKNK